MLTVAGRSLSLAGVIADVLGHSARAVVVFGDHAHRHEVARMLRRSLQAPGAPSDS